MYKIEKTFEIAVAHHLDLDYDSPCLRCHGHNLILTIYLASKELDKNGMVLDFTQIKQKIQDQLDHKDLNEIEGIGFEFFRGKELVPYTEEYKERGEKQTLNPTAERLAEWICHQFPECYRVDVQESKGNVATYYDDGFWVKFYDD